jgi:hypothetical protein
MPQTINGDNVIGYTSARRIADLAYQDRARLDSWYRENPDRTHLGLLQTVSARENVAFPLFEDLLKNAGRITVNGPGGTFRYDMPVNTVQSTYTVADTCTRHERPGIDSGVFEIILNQPFSPGDVLTYGAQSGQNIMVSGETPVRQVGSGYLHTVKLVSQTRKSWYPPDKLRAGIQYFKIGHLAGEYSTQLSAPLALQPTASVTCEFTLGNHRGVETASSMYAGDRYLKNADSNSVRFMERALRQIESWGKTPDGHDIDTIVIAQQKMGRDGKINLANAKVMHAMEYLAFAELFRLENTANMFQRAGLIEDNNSVIRANEGLWWQFMRGYTVGYSRPGALQMSHIRQAVEYIHRNNRHMPLEKRWTRFKCGQMAYQNCMKLVQDEFTRQMQWMAPLTGSERLLPQNPVSGPNDKLKLGIVRPVECFMPGIGNVRFEHEPALDVMPMDDVHSKGFYGSDKPWTSWSLYVEDITGPDASNAYAYAAKPQESKNIRVLHPGKNIYYITPEQGSLHWGNSTGRWDARTNSNISSSDPHFWQTFFCHSVSAVWVADLSRICVIHLENAA